MPGTEAFIAALIDVSGGVKVAEAVSAASASEEEAADVTDASQSQWSW